MVEASAKLTLVFIGVEEIEVSNFILLAAAAVLVAAFAIGISAQPRLLSLPVGTEVVPRGELEAKNSVPSALSLSAGDVVTTITPREVYIVREVEIVSSILLRDRYYMRIVENGGSGPCQADPCWVYQGTESSDLEPNLVPRR